MDLWVALWLLFKREAYFWGGGPWCGEEEFPQEVGFLKKFKTLL